MGKLKSKTQNFSHISKTKHRNAAWPLGWNWAFFDSRICRAYFDCRCLAITSNLTNGVFFCWWCRPTMGKRKKTTFLAPVNCISVEINGAVAYTNRSERVGISLTKMLFAKLGRGDTSACHSCYWPNFAALDSILRGLYGRKHAVVSQALAICMGVVANFRPKLGEIYLAIN